MVRVNCSAIPDTLIESELFGREKGAYTGALARQAGRFELARSSVALPRRDRRPAGRVQVKLLRVLDERKIERLGSPTDSVDTRIIRPRTGTSNGGSPQARFARICSTG